MRSPQNPVVRFLSLFRIMMFFLGLIIAVLVTVGSTYLLDNPIEKASSSIKSPFILTVKPTLLGKTESTSITVQLLTPPRNMSKLSSPFVRIIGPDGEKFSPIKNGSKFIFPNDFKDFEVRASNPLLEGNYTVLLLSPLDNKIVTSLFFSVTYIPWLSYFTNFVLGKGLAISLGIIVAIIPIAFQFFSQNNQDRSRRREDKAKWMNDNGKHYINIIENSEKICHYLEDEESHCHRKQHEPIALRSSIEQSDAENILIYTISFYKDFLQFTRNTSIYYFDDYNTEDFADRLEEKILDMTNTMLTYCKSNKFDYEREPVHNTPLANSHKGDEYLELKRFFDRTPVDLRNNPSFAAYSKRVFLLIPNNKREFLYDK